MKFKRDGESLFEWFIRTIAILMLFGITVSFIMSLVAPKPVEEVVEETITYNNFLEMVEKGEVSSIQYSDELELIPVTLKDGREFEIPNPNYETFKHEMMVHDIEIVPYEETSDGLGFLGALINLVWILVMFYFLSMVIFKNPSRETKVHHSVQIHEEPLDNNKEGVPYKTFSDVAGLKEAKKDLATIVDFLKNRNKYEEAGAKLPKGVLLYGPPGTGKTLLAKAIAGEAGVSFLFASASDFSEMYVGVGASRIRNLFKEARRHSPCIVFIDEIDALGKSRTTNSHHDHDQTLNALLTEMDGFLETENVLVIGATNRPEMLDDALLRPGRFTNKYCIPLPETPEERLEIIELYQNGKRFDETVDFVALSKELVGFSPAQIESLLNEATIISVQERHDFISKADIDKAMIKMVIEGHVKEDQTGRSKEELKIVAWHEAGHALIGKLKGKNVPKVTILSTTSGAGGFTISHSEKEHLLSKQDLVNEVMELYAGRVGESILFNGNENLITTGASSDFERATNIIEKLVMKLGMTDKFGPIVISKDEATLKEMIFQEKVRLSKEIYEKTEELLNTHRNKLEAIANALLEKETIYAEDLDKILE